MNMEEYSSFLEADIFQKYKNRRQIFICLLNISVELTFCNLYHSVHI